MPARASSSADDRIEINRAPVLTLWAAVVAERLGYARGEALTLGRAVAGLNAQSKGQRLGLFEATSGAEAHKRRAALKPGTALRVELLGRAVPAVHTHDGVHATEKGDRPTDPAAVQRYLESKFGDALPTARRAFQTLAASRPPARLAETGFELYEAFRPVIPKGKTGWGAKGVLDLAHVRKLAKE
jgi:hypothetical protein